MIDELRPFLPEDIEVDVFEISLHTRPAFLKSALQQAIDAADGKFDPIFLAYGLCSNAVVGLCAKQSRLVIPRQHDCIGIFLGSTAARREQMEVEPGTYFLTQGYIEGHKRDHTGPIGEYEQMVARYGQGRADVLIHKMMGQYKRLVYLKAAHPRNLEGDREYARNFAARFGMRYEERDTCNDLLRRMMNPEWDQDFVVVPPGQEIGFEQFM